jgi:large subunit ribosomal protein L7/L12
MMMQQVGTNLLRATVRQRQTRIAAPVALSFPEKLGLYSIMRQSFSTEAPATEEERPHPTSIQYSFTPPAKLSAENQAKVDGLFTKIMDLDMIELHLLTSLVQEKMGLKVGATDMASAAGQAQAGGAAEEEASAEKVLKDVKLVGFDPKAKIKVIKEVRSIGGYGLKEAKELVEGVPKIIKKELKPEEAEELKATLEALGAQVEIV